MTKAPLPQTGGAYARDKDGSLTRLDAPKTNKTAASKDATKEE